MANVQSALHAAGVEAELAATTWWVMFGGALLVLLLVVCILMYVLFRAPGRRAALRPGWFIFAGGVALPAITLTALLIYTLDASARLRGNVGGDAGGAVVDIQVIGHRWWWEVRYRSEDMQQWFVTANELHLPVGTKSRVTVTTADVIHSFWVPSLAGKIDLLPGYENRIVLQPTRTGVSRGQCAEFCGAQHARMALYVVVRSANEFREWRARQLRDAVTPTDPLAKRGHEVFMRSGCPLCHTIRGTRSLAAFGPDLTHVASRRSIAAGTLPTTEADFAAWIVDSQHFKPDNLMPAFRSFSGEELRALAAYMRALR